MTNRIFYVLLCIVLSGCVRARFNLQPQAHASNPVVSNIVSGVKSAVLEAELVLPRSQYTVVDRDLSIRIKSGTRVTASIRLPPESLSGNTIFLPAISGRLQFSKPLIAKKGRLIQGAVSSIEVQSGKGHGDLDVDLFQTFLALVFNSGAPHGDDERPLSPAEVLPRLNVRNFEIHLRDNFPVSLNGPNPISLRTKQGNSLFLSSVSWTDESQFSAARQMKGAEYLVYLLQHSNVQEKNDRVSFRANGNAVIHAEDLSARSSGEVKLVASNMSATANIQLTGATGKPIMIRLGRDAGLQASTVAIDTLKAVRNDWELTAQRIAFALQSLNLALTPSGGTSNTLAANLTGKLGGELTIYGTNASIAASTTEAAAEMSVTPADYKFTIPNGVRLGRTSVEFQNDTSRASLKISGIQLGPIAVTGSVSHVPVGTIGGVHAGFESFSISAKRGALLFGSDQGGNFDSTNDFVFSSTGFLFPSSTVSVKKASVTLRDSQTDAAIRDIGLLARIENLHQKHWNADGELTATGQGRVAVEDKTFVDINASIKRMKFNADESHLDWDISDGSFGVGWIPIIKAAESKEHRTPLKENSVTIGNLGLVRDIANTGGHAVIRNLRLQPYGDEGNARVHMSGVGGVHVPITYRAIHPHVRWELKEIKVFGKTIAKTHLPVFSAKWDPESCELFAPFAADFKNGRVHLAPEEKLVDSKVVIDFDWQFSPALITVIIPRGCEVNLTATTILVDLLAPIVSMVSGIGAKWIKPIETTPFDKLGEKWNKTKVRRLILQRWSKDYLAIEFDGSGTYPFTD